MDHVWEGHRFDSASAGLTGSAFPCYEVCHRGGDPLHVKTGRSLCFPKLTLWRLLGLTNMLNRATPDQATEVLGRLMGVLTFKPLIL